MQVRIYDHCVHNKCLDWQLHSAVQLISEVSTLLHASNGQCWCVSKNINKKQEVMWFIFHSLKSDIQNNNRILHYRLKKKISMWYVDFFMLSCSCHICLLSFVFYVICGVFFFHPCVPVLFPSLLLLPHLPFISFASFAPITSLPSPVLLRLSSPAPHPFLSIVCIEVVSSVQSSLTIISCIWAL